MKKYSSSHSQDDHKEWHTPSRRGQKPRQHPRDSEEFRCKRCKMLVGNLPSGGHHRNHCPFCLYSLHIDAERSGDRASTCRSVMQPVGAFQRRNGEHVIVHRCLGCGFERFNRIAADDNFHQVLSLPTVPVRTRRTEEMRRTSGKNEVS